MPVPRWLRGPRSAVLLLAQITHCLFINVDLNGSSKKTVVSQFKFRNDGPKKNRVVSAAGSTVRPATLVAFLRAPFVWKLAAVLYILCITNRLAIRAVLHYPQ
jgi:hypothetical protein